MTRRLVDRSLLRQLNGASVVAGVALFVLLGALAFPVASFFHTRELVWLIPAQAAGLLFDTGRSAPVGVLLRDGQFRRVAALEAIRQTIAAVVVLSLALLNRGYWALVAGPVISSMAICVLAQARTGIGFQWPAWPKVRKELGHASVVLSSQVLWFFFMNSPFLIVGRRFGAQAFGLMSIAWLLCLQPLDKIGSVVTPVLTSAFAAAGSGPRPRGDGVLIVAEAMLMVYGLLLGGLAITSDLAVPLILGQKWNGAVAVVRYFCGFAVMYGVVTALQSVLIARGQARTVLQANTAGLFLMGGGAVLFVTNGGADVMARWWALTYPFVAWWPLYVLGRLEGLTLARTLPVILRAISVLAASLLSVIGVRLLWPADSSGWAELIGSAAIGGTVFVLATLMANGPLVELTRRRLGSIKPSG